MRIKLTLQTSSTKCTIPLNYNYFLTSAIYHTLETSSPAYSSFLHNHGYQYNSKKFKLFTYSQLFAEKRRIVDNTLQILSTDVTWYLTSPMDDFVQSFVDGLFNKGQFIIGGYTFALLRAETLQEPEFKNEMRFKCLSPITISTKIEKEGKLLLKYCEPGEEFNKLIRQNLIRKHEVLYGKPPEDDTFKLEFDQEYVSRRNGNISKLIDFKGIKIRGYLAPATVSGSPELIKVGYRCGLGDKNSAGFGMVEAANTR